MNKYAAFYNGKKATVEASSLYGAKLKAIEVFKPRKSQEHMVSVVLAEVEGRVVTHVAVD